jgi:site-specific DNA recombinase
LIVIGLLNVKPKPGIPNCNAPAVPVKPERLVIFMKNKKITAIYYRTSKSSKNNVKMQKTFCRRYCKEKNIKNFKEYQDIAISGLKQNRPALNKLIQDIKENKIKQVIVYKMDRLGRNFTHLNEIYNDLEKQNIKLTCATQNFNTSIPEGKLLLRMIMLLSEFESNITSKRTIDGLKCLKEKDSKLIS